MLSRLPKHLTKGMATLTLAGCPLPLPRIEPVDWVENQVFNTLDDPDRTNPLHFPWEGPSFLKSKSPAGQQASTWAEDLDVKGAGVKGYKDGFSFAKVVYNVLSQEQCLELINCVNAKGFTPALLNIGGGRQILAPGVRDGLRAIVDSKPLTQYLLEVVKPHLPEALRERGQAQTLVDLNERCRFLCYTPGHVFEPHIDGRFTRTPPHHNSGDRSAVTMQLYLHDVPSEHGGATTFLGFPSRYKTRMGQSGKVVFQPRAGSALLFTQDLMHEGSEVVAGIKYTMRTEAMYRTRAESQEAKVQSR